MFYVSSLLLQVLNGVSKENETYALVADKDRQVIIERVMDYCKAIPAGVDRQNFNRQMAIFARAVGFVLDSDTYLDLLLKVTSFRHLATYVHSLQVQNITGILAKHLVTHAPEYFVGMCGTNNTVDVKKSQNELISMACQAALCHDVGKIAYMNTIANCSRKLYQFEFDVLKEHTSTDLAKFGEEKMECVIDVIAGHHKWHNNKGGYLEYFDRNESKFGIIIDMVTVADSIDAATDTVGRSYAAGLTLEQIATEVKAQSGVDARYSPVVAAALNDRDVLDEIRECIGDGRKEAYYQAYLAIISEKADGVVA